MNSKLVSLIADNFAVYYRAHTFHLNVTGPNFVQYHELFGEVYDKLFDWHDTLAENLRQGGDRYPLSLKTLLNTTAVADDSAGVADPSKMLKCLYSDLEALIESAAKLYRESDPALETTLGDYSADLSKLCWKLAATIG